MKTETSASAVLGSPLRINSLDIKNRIILGPMAVLRPTEDGRPSAQSIAFLRRRARGGVGLVFVGGAVASERAWNESPFFPNIRFDKDEFVPDLARMVGLVQQDGAAIFAQLFPSFGRMGVPRGGAHPIAASPKPVVLGAAGFPDHVYVPGGRVTPPPAEATVEDIRAVQADVVSAARRAKAAGFDGVEIGAHMCYFYSSFLSPLANQRTDEYGGSAENRARALRDTVAAVRAEVGPHYPVGIRMSVNDHMPGGQGPAGFAEVAGHIVTAGVDFISLSEANYESMAENVPSQSGNMLAHGEPQAFRAAVGGIPLFLSSTTDPQQAADAITAGHADATMLARQLLADPDYPNKVIEGREGEIVWCDHANSCMRRLMTNIPVACHKNPEMGHEDPEAKRATPLQSLFVWAAGNAFLMAIADKAAKAAPKPKH
ncbi:MAG: NADH:flavin oxidoreductase [Microbacterium sp.]